MSEPTPDRPTADIATTPDEARTIDATGGIVARIVALQVVWGATAAVCLAVIGSFVYAILVGVVVAGTAAMARHLFRERRRRLANFVDPASGRIEIPGGRTPQAASSMAVQVAITVVFSALLAWAILSA